MSDDRRTDEEGRVIPEGAIKEENGYTYRLMKYEAIFVFSDIPASSAGDHERADCAPPFNGLPLYPLGLVYKPGCGPGYVSLEEHNRLVDEKIKEVKEKIGDEVLRMKDSNKDISEYFDTIEEYGFNIFKIIDEA